MLNLSILFYNGRVVKIIKVFGHSNKRVAKIGDRVSISDIINKFK